MFVKKKGALCLVGKLWVARVINRGVLHATMGKIWWLSSKVVFKEVGPNVFLISFASISNMSRIEQGRPWLFDNSIFVIEQFNGLTPPNDFKFDKASLWV